MNQYLKLTLSDSGRTGGAEADPLLHEMQEGAAATGPVPLRYLIYVKLLFFKLHKDINQDLLEVN